MTHNCQKDSDVVRARKTAVQKENEGVEGMGVNYVHR